MTSIGDLSRLELLEEVTDLFWSLGPAHRQALYYMISGYSLSEISDLMGVDSLSARRICSNVRRQARAFHQEDESYVHDEA